MIQFMPANHSNTNLVITILIHSDKTHFQNDFVMLLRRVAKDVTSSLFHGINATILMPQIFKVIANEIARYKRNELEWCFTSHATIFQSYNVTAQMCRRIEEVVPKVGLPTP